MDRDAMRRAPTGWIGLGGRAVIRLEADGTYAWKADSHPGLGPDQMTELVRARCVELERAIGELDMLLPIARETGADDAVDDLLDRRSDIARRLRMLRGFLARREDLDAAA